MEARGQHVLVDYPSGRKSLLKEIVRDEVVFGTGSVPRLSKNRLTRQFFWQLPVGLLEQEVYTPTVEICLPGVARQAVPERHPPGRGASGENPNSLLFPVPTFREFALNSGVLCSKRTVYANCEVEPFRGI